MLGLDCNFFLLVCWFRFLCGFFEGGGRIFFGVLRLLVFGLLCYNKPACMVGPYTSVYEVYHPSDAFKCALV